MGKQAGIVAKAAAFARRIHEGQKRLSGDPYFVHAAAVGEAVATLALDDAAVAAAFLHDVVEESDVTAADLTERFGAETSRLVIALTNLRRLDFASEAEYERANLARMFLAMAGDVRVVIIKLADRLDNLRSLEHLPPGRRRRFARESLYLFAPLADRLGLGQLRWELEDLSFRHLEPARYRELAAAVARRRAARERRVAEVAREIGATLVAAGVRAKVSGRAKNLYSIYRKMTRDGRGFDELYDLLGLRIVAADVADCYRALDAVHAAYERVAGRYKDYIARPKANLYRSIHTTLRLPRGDAVEVQLRTAEMEAVAEYGVAAHWLYKKRKDARGRDWGDYPALRLMRAAVTEMGASVEQRRLGAFLADLVKEDVFVFTPKGEVKRLPRGATPVDFAYTVHTAVGERCVGARVNGRLVALRTVLETGDVVEIQTSAASSPSRDWLDFVVSSSARHKVRAFFRRQDRAALTALGRTMLSRELSRRRLAPADVLRAENLDDIARRRGLSSGEELLARVGEGALSATAVVTAETAARPPAQAAVLTGLPDYSPYVVVAGMEHVEVKMAGCCKPLPLAALVGYVTSRGAVSVHRADCATVRRLTPSSRLIDARWRLDEEVAGIGVLNFALADSERALPDIVRRLRRVGLRVAGIATEERRGVLACTLHLRLVNAARLRKAVASLGSLPAVSSLEHRIYG